MIRLPDGRVVNSDNIRSADWRVERAVTNMLCEVFPQIDAASSKGVNTPKPEIRKGGVNEWPSQVTVRPPPPPPSNPVRPAYKPPARVDPMTRRAIERGLANQMLADAAVNTARLQEQMKRDKTDDEPPDAA